MRKLLIMRCDDSRKWYANKIGEFVPLLDEERSHYEYKSRQDNGYINYVNKNDAVIFEDGVDEI